MVPKRWVLIPGPGACHLFWEKMYLRMLKEEVPWIIQVSPIARASILFREKWNEMRTEEKVMLPGK